MTDRSDHDFTIPGIEVTDVALLKDWLKSKPHRLHCEARSEGQWCCLDKLTGDWLSEAGPDD